MNDKFDHLSIELTCDKGQGELKLVWEGSELAYAILKVGKLDLVVSSKTFAQEVLTSQQESHSVYSEFRCDGYRIFTFPGTDELTMNMWYQIMCRYLALSKDYFQTYRGTLSVYL